jgi:hypothetical protein
MSDFSDRDDWHLVTLAKEYEDRDEKVSWAALAEAMKHTSKDPRALKRRLTTLKSTYGKLLRDFPSRYTKMVEPVRIIQPRRYKPVFILPRLKVSAVVVERALEVSLHPSTISKRIVTPSSISATCRNSPPRREIDISEGPNAQNIAEVKTTSPSESRRAVAQIFARIGKSDVRQAAGRTELNVGEISTDGVTYLIARCQLQQADIFIDVGSGVGNVIAQVALESLVNRAIGIEVRANLASLGSKAIVDATPIYPRLSQAVNRQGDVLDLAKDWSLVADCTVLYCNNLVFTEEANLSLHHLCCVLSTLRIVVLGTEVCPRHRRRCTKAFCMLWGKEASTLNVQTEFRHNHVTFHVYTRRRE